MILVLQTQSSELNVNVSTPNTIQVPTCDGTYNSKYIFSWPLGNTNSNIAGQ